jgi:CrcB protein
MEELLMRYLFLAIFGLIGVFARYSVNTLASHIPGTTFPFTTLAINIIGSFLIGIVYVLGSERLLMNEDVRIGLMTGLLGGFTTFSAFSLDAVKMGYEGQYLLSGLYLLVSVGGGLGATVLGLYVGKQI